MPAMPPGEGWEPIPGSTLAGFRRRRPNGGWSYYYPRPGGGIPAHRRDVSDQETQLAKSIGERMATNGQKLMHRMHHSARHTIQEFPAAGRALVKMAKGQKPEKEEAKAMLSAGVTLGHIGLAFAAGGLGAAALTGIKHLATHTLLAAVHKHLASSYVGYGGATLGEHLLEHSSHLAEMALADQGGLDQRAKGAEEPTDSGVDDETVNKFASVIFEAIKEAVAHYHPNATPGQQPAAPTQQGGMPGRPMGKGMGLLLQQGALGLWHGLTDRGPAPPPPHESHVRHFAHVHGHARRTNHGITMVAPHERAVDEADAPPAHHQIASQVAGRLGGAYDGQHGVTVGRRSYSVEPAPRGDGVRVYHGDEIIADVARPDPEVVAGAIREHSGVSG